MAFLYAGIALLAFLAYRLCHKLPPWVQMLVGVAVFALLASALVAYQRRTSDNAYEYSDDVMLYEESFE